MYLHHYLLDTVELFHSVLCCGMVFIAKIMSGNMCGAVVPFAPR